jgi:hypothetical protein
MQLIDNKIKLLSQFILRDLPWLFRFFQCIIRIIIILTPFQATSFLHRIKIFIQVIKVFENGKVYTININMLHLNIYNNYCPKKGKPYSYVLK